MHRIILPIVAFVVVFLALHSREVQDESKDPGQEEHASQIEETGYPLVWATRSRSSVEGDETSPSLDVEEELVINHANLGLYVILFAIPMIGLWVLNRQDQK